MRRILPMVMALAIVGTVPVLGAEMTVTGELVDHACFVRSGPEGGAGESHEACAVACAQTGQPVALVTENGDVYLLAGQVTVDTNADLVPHMSHTVEVTGEVTDSDGVKTITTDAVKPIAAN